MRVLRTSLAMAAALGLAQGLAVAQDTPEALLTGNQPVFRGVEYDLPAAVVKAGDPATKAAVAACKVESNKRGWTVRDGQGRILRRFLDTDGKQTQRGSEKDAGPHLDQWSYYLDGFEVYRESDTNEDGSLDEIRWLNAGGTRIAKVKPNEKGGGVRVVSWERISAEEASKVLVQALVAGDRLLLESVIATPEELTSIGAPQKTIDRVSESRANRTKAVAALNAFLKETGWSNSTTWSRFDGMMPRVIPSDSAPGMKNEVTLYENVVVFADAGNPAAAAKMGYLSAPEIVKIGEAWKFVDLPHGVDPVKPAAGSLVSLRGEIFGQAPVEPDTELEKLLAKLRTHDGVQPPNDKQSKAEWHLARVKILHEIVAVCKDTNDKLLYNKQAVNDLCEAIRTDLYPAGFGVLNKMVAGGGKIASYAQHQKLRVEFDLEADQPGVDVLKLQNASLVKFGQFLKDFPKSDEEPEVLLHLGNINDFNGDEAAATKWYTQLATDHSGTDAGKKAIGALRRLELDGKPLKVSGTGLDGKAVSSDSYRGKPLLVVYWSNVDANELADVAKLKQKLGAKGFEVLGVCLDGDKTVAAKVAKDLPSDWATIFEPGGMDSRLANELGIISTPTMILTDGKGLVVNRKIRKAYEVEKVIDRAIAGRGVGLNR